MNRRALLLILGSSFVACFSACPTATPCSAKACDGCCDAEGVCRPGTADTACGSASATCSACGAGLTCQANACVAQSTGGGTGGGSGGGAAGGAAGGSGGGTGGQSGTFTVSGRVTYDFVKSVYDPSTGTGTLDFAALEQRPVRNGQVKVVEGTSVLATTNTAADGTYSLTFTSTGAAALAVQALAKTATPPIVVQDNCSGGAVWAISAPVPVGGGALDLRATAGWVGTHYDAATRSAGPFAILDSMYSASTIIATARPALQFPLLRVNWSPRNSTATNGPVSQGFLGTSYYDGQDNQIYVVGKDQEDTDEYDNHVIVHEWGHFFESNFSRSDSIAGDHATGDRLDPRVSFSEGWGDAASGMLTGDPLYSDTYWDTSGLSGFGFDVSVEPSPTDDPSPGPLSEASVMRALYNGFEARNRLAFDHLAVGAGGIADALTAGHRTTSALTTIASFVTALKAEPGVNAADVDTLLAHYRIGPITDDFGTGDATLRAMYAEVTTLPLNVSVSLNARSSYNFADQNKYWVLTGNGNQVTVSATSTKDVGVSALERGVEVGSSDALSGGGTESFSFASQSGVVYVISLTGYGTGTSNYNASVSITSP